ncbi:MAG: hypothetical protein E7578_03070 [Ruminococcaceae bacterium]|nr:hypothetical protein [Oscillospiraceae bacterium]
MKNRIMSLVLAGVISAGTVGAVSAEETAERAKGIKFLADSAYRVNTSTGYVGGVTPDTTVATLLGALENKNGVDVIRDKTLGASDEVQHGDMLTLKAEDGAVKAQYEIIFMGNANKDTKVNLGDAAAMLQKIAKWEVAIDEIASDVNGDGAVNLSDVSLLLQNIAGWEKAKFVKTPVLPGKGDSRVSSSISTSDATTPTDNPGNINLRKGQDLGVKFTVPEGKVGKYAKANFPSWGDSKGSIRLSLYKWDTDYATTVANDSIYTEYHENFADGTEFKLNFLDSAGKGIPAGDYVWRIHDGFDERINPDNESEPVGVGLFATGCPKADSGVTIFFEGEALDPESKDSFGPIALIGIGD